MQHWSCSRPGNTARVPSNAGSINHCVPPGLPEPELELEPEPEPEIETETETETEPLL